MRGQLALTFTFLGLSAWSGEASGQAAPAKSTTTYPAVGRGVVSPAPRSVPASAAVSPAPAPQSISPAAPAPAAAPVPAAVPANATPPVTTPAPASEAQATPVAPTAFAVPQGYVLVPVGTVPQSPGQQSTAEAMEREEAMIENYQEGDPVPSGYRTIREPRKGLVIAGSIVGGIAYGFSVIGAVGDDFKHKSGSLLIPGLGPWLMLALGGAKDEPCAANTYYSGSDMYSRSCGDKAGLRAALALDGVMQVAGFTMLAFGIAYPRTRLVRRSVELSMAPLHFGQHGYGLGAVGRF